MLLYENDMKEINIYICMVFDICEIENGEKEISMK